VFLNDQVAEVDADAELDALLWPGSLIALSHPPLNLDRTPDGIDHARELGKEAVAGVLTMRPRCSAIFGSNNSLICALSRS
jgi:hypothetical protein